MIASPAHHPPLPFSLSPVPLLSLSLSLSLLSLSPSHPTHAPHPLALSLSHPLCPLFAPPPPGFNIVGAIATPIIGLGVLGVGAVALLGGEDEDEPAPPPPPPAPVAAPPPPMPTGEAPAPAPAPAPPAAPAPVAGIEEDDDDAYLQVRDHPASPPSSMTFAHTSYAPDVGAYLCPQALQARAKKLIAEAEALENE